jgi:hypothetical protein
MPIGPDVLVFVSATRALLKSLRHQPLNDEEKTEIQDCLRELMALFPPDKKRHAA